MLKLYKRLGEATLYWEAWDVDPDHLAIHTGRLGDTGVVANAAVRRREGVDRAIQREAKTPRKAGYVEIPPEQHARMLVQYRTLGHGSPEDVDKAETVCGILNECLGWTGNGHCDGHDIGSGSVNEFCFVVDAVVACASSVEALREAGLLDGATVAVEADEGFHVLWPGDFDGEFAYAYGV